LVDEVMTHDEALTATQEHLHLIGKEFKLQDGETESIKAVVAWDEGGGNWQPHVCFYNWSEENTDGKITHMNLEEFNRQFNLRAE
jgi:hypothetical protein